jgi:type 1 glutamine amidotransferase
MKASPRYGAPLIAVSLAALASWACSASGPSIDDLNNMPPGTTGGSDTMPSAGSSGSGTTTGGGGAASTGGGSSAGGETTTGGVVGTGGMVSTGGAVTGGSDAGGTPPMGGTAGMDAGGGGSGGMAMGGTGGVAPTGPYAPRTGSFKMMVYSRTKGYRHDTSIESGKAMLAEIATAQGFQIVQVESDADNTQYITPEGLAQFEIIFFLNSTGDIFTAAQQKTYEDWMTQKNGAFAGVHSATDTENGWAFYSEVTGQYYNGHSNAGTPGQIQLEASMLDFPALKGIPNPWQRNEEWYNFNSWQQWTTKPGFKILGKKAADGQPIMWTREYGNFRSFYTAIGHDRPVFQDATVKKHITGGIMWAVRREALIK